MGAKIPFAQRQWILVYAKGMSTRAISDFICEMYAMEISAAEISRITVSGEYTWPK
uniref:transposase n=1 Tax=Sphingobacterium thalpophilum TaxID=259 RepID=UPI0010FD6B10